MRHTQADKADGLIFVVRRVVRAAHGATCEHPETLRERLDGLTWTITVEEVVDVEGGR